MTITKKYAKRLIKQGKAREVGKVRDNGSLYMAIDRLDIQRTDHYLIS